MLLTDQVVRPLYGSIHPHLTLGAVLGDTVIGRLDGAIVILRRFSRGNVLHSIRMVPIGIVEMFSPSRMIVYSTGIIIVVSVSSAVSVDVLAITTSSRGRGRSWRQNTSACVIKPFLPRAEGGARPTVITVAVTRRMSRLPLTGTQA